MLKRYDKTFWILCISAVFFFGGFNMVIPELPDYVTSLGGPEFKGLVIALFTLTAMLSRPFSGKLTDTIGRTPVMIFGAAVSLVAGLIYPVIGSVAALLLLRAFHGLSTGFNPTGTAAYVADIIPDNRRGEAMGILGLFNSIGMAIGPSVGGYISAAYGTNVLFYVSAGVAFISVILIWSMRETMDKPKKFKPAMLKVKISEFYEPRVLAPSITMLLTVFSFGTVLTIMPDYTVYMGFENKGIFFTVFVISSLAIRLAAGKVSDRFGRVPVLKVSAFTVALAMLSIGLAQTGTHLIMSAILFGVAVGSNSPTVFAWTIDLSRKAARGKGMSTMYIALEIGIGGGALISAALYNNNPDNFQQAFWFAGGLAFLAFLYLMIFEKRFPVEEVEE